MTTRRKDAPYLPPIPRTAKARAEMLAAARRERFREILKRTYASRRELDAVIATGRTSGAGSSEIRSQGSASQRRAL